MLRWNYSHAEVKDDLVEKNVPLEGEFKDHPSFSSLVESGYTVFTF